MAFKHDETQPHPNTPFSQARRSALKKMLVGTGVAAGAAVLPEKWATPVVNKVLVPAHAQTSPVPTTTKNCSPAPLILSSVTVTCAEEGGIERNSYSIDDSDPCRPRFVEGGDIYIQTHVFWRRVGTSVVITVYLQVYFPELPQQPNYVRTAKFLDCNSEPFYTFPEAEQEINTVVEGMNGIIYDVQGTLTSSGQTIEMSALTFTPQ